MNRLTDWALAACIIVLLQFIYGVVDGRIVVLKNAQHFEGKK